MKTTLLVVGKNKTAYIREALEEYEKRISKYIPFRIQEIQAIKHSGKDTENGIKEKEAHRILRTLPQSAIVVLLDEQGEQTTSQGFAQWLQKEMASGIRHLVFIIGGAYGFASEVYEKADKMISLSKMTFSHQIIRVIFAEQLYRALTMLNGDPYHHGT
jgi:23S rRNA (pseudouridine1915-N3)-methyltransferase